MKMKKGEYYVGDPCYVIKDEDWHPLLQKSDFFNHTKGWWAGEYNGHPIFAGSTAWGDGTYTDIEGREYSVDAGLIGIMPVEAMTANFGGHGGQIIDFEEDFEVSWEDGIFHLGPVFIDTTE